MLHSCLKLARSYLATSSELHFWQAYLQRACCSPGDNFRNAGSFSHQAFRSPGRSFSQGHVETIFDCKFKPSDPKLLATASFDGTVKLWSVDDLTTVQTTTGNEGVIYSVSWAPGNAQHVPLLFSTFLRL